MCVRRSLKVLIPFALSWGVTVQTSAQDNPAPAGTRVGLDALIQKTIEHDPNLARLRKEVEIARARVSLAAPRNDPQLRIGYSHSTDPAVRRPYTETREETIQERGSSSGSSTTTENNRSSETRNGSASETTQNSSGRSSRSEQSNERRDSNQQSTTQNSARENYTDTITRTTRREVTPGKNSETIRETVTETSNRNFSGSGSSRESSSGSERRSLGKSGTNNGGNAFSSNETQSFATRGSGSASESERGSSTSRIVQDITENRFFSDDQVDGTDEFSAQIRLYPRNPWEKRAQISQAEGDVRLAQAYYNAAARTISNDVRLAYLDLQFFNADVGMEEKRLVQMEKEATFTKELMSTGNADADDYTRTRIAIVDTRLDIASLQESRDKQLARLAARAHVSDASTIDLSDLPASRKIKLEDIDPNALTAAALNTQSQLIVLKQRSKILTNDINLNNSAKYPWLSLITASYANEQRYGHTYQEDFSVVAGFDLPIWSWLGENKSKPLQLEKESLEEEQRLIAARIENTIHQRLELLKKKRKKVGEFAASYRDLKKEINDIKIEVGQQGPLAIRQQNKLDAQLVDLDIRALRITRDYAQSLLNFESIIGTDLDQL